MKKALEEAKGALADMMRAYLVERDVESALRYATEDVYSVGPGNETALGKAALRTQMQRAVEADPRPYELHDAHFTAKAMGTGVLILCRMQAARPSEAEQPVFQTASLQKEQGTYKIGMLHTSIAHPGQDGKRRGCFAKAAYPGKRCAVGAGNPNVAASKQFHPRRCGRNRLGRGVHANRRQ